MNSDDEEALLTRLDQLYVVSNALSAYATQAPEHVRRWALQELEATSKILNRLRPPAFKGVGGAWWDEQQRLKPLQTGTDRPPSEAQPMKQNVTPPNKNVSPPMVPYYVVIRRGNIGDLEVAPIYDKVTRGFHHRSALDTALTTLEVSAPAWASVKPTAGTDGTEAGSDARETFLYVLGAGGWNHAGSGVTRPGG